MELVQYTGQYNDTNNEFYPTPHAVAEKLLEGIDFRRKWVVLEPSAGKGNLVWEIIHRSVEACFSFHDPLYYRIERLISVDAVEIDPYLRQVLSYDFSNEVADEVFEEVTQMRKLKEEYNPDTHSYRGLTPEEDAHYKEVTKHYVSLKSLDFHIVGNNFLDFQSKKQYNLIVMNPPFSNGDEHLIKAIELIEPYGGVIRCVLNAETLRNRYSAKRKYLWDKLSELGADVSYMEDAFVDSERFTDVEIAIVSINIPEPEINAEDSVFYSNLKASPKYDDSTIDTSECTDLALGDFIARIVQQFNFEIDLGIKMIKEYRAASKYMLSSFTPGCNGSTLHLTVGGTKGCDINDYITLVRGKYWDALFANKEFAGRLTSDLLDSYRKKIDELSAYDFSVFNIEQIAQKMQQDMSKGIHDVILSLFSKLSETHSWYPECEKNIHYFNGWATNKAYMIGKKVILPVNGMYSEYSWQTKNVNVYKAKSVIEDIEKVFDYLDCGETQPVSLDEALEVAAKIGTIKNMKCKYFTVTIYKKGTMHMTFHNQRLVDKFNIYCCKGKNWLPGTYGKKNYQDMTPEEKQIVDNFNGNGKQGSGESAYQAIVSDAKYYLQEPKSQVLMLTDGN